MKSRQQVKHRLVNRPTISMKAMSLVLKKDKAVFKNGTLEVTSYADMRYIAKSDAAVIRLGGQDLSRVGALQTVLATLNPFINADGSHNYSYRRQNLKRYAKKHNLRLAHDPGVEEPIVYSITGLTQEQGQALLEWSRRYGDVTLSEHSRALPSNGTAGHAKAFHSPRPKKAP